jgi:hypothetical protein
MRYNEVTRFSASRFKLLKDLMTAATPSFISQRLSRSSESITACSIANARIIFEKHLPNLTSSVAVLSLGIRLARKPLFLVLAEDVERAFTEILTFPVSTPSSALQTLLHGPAQAGVLGPTDCRPQVLVTSTMKQEVAQWAKRQGVEQPTSGPGTPAQLNALPPHKNIDTLKALAERAGDRAIYYVSASDLAAAETISVLTLGSWSATANEGRIAKRYLDFVNRYLLGALEEPYAIEY